MFRLIPAIRILGAFVLLLVGSGLSAQPGKSVPHQTAHEHIETKSEGLHPSGRIDPYPPGGSHFVPTRSEGKARYDESLNSKIDQLKREAAAPEKSPAPTVFLTEDGFQTNTSSLSLGAKDLKSLLKSLEEHEAPAHAQKIQFLMGYDQRYTPELEKLLSEYAEKPRILLPDGTYSEVKVSNGKLYYKKEGYYLEKSGLFEEYFSQDSRIREPRFKKESVVISLINNDTRTSHDIEHLRSSVRVIKVTKEDYAELNRIIEEQKDKNIFLIGHIEQSSYVSYNQKQEREFSVDIDAINKLSKMDGLSLMALGCNSIGNKSDVGYNSNINSVTLVKQLEQAVKSNSLDELFNALALVTTHEFLVNQAFLNGQTTFEGRLKAQEKQSSPSIDYISVSIPSGAVINAQEPASAPPASTDQVLAVTAEDDLLYKPVTIVIISCCVIFGAIVVGYRFLKKRK